MGVDLWADMWPTVNLVGLCSYSGGVVAIFVGTPNRQSFDWFIGFLRGTATKLLPVVRAFARCSKSQSIRFFLVPRGTPVGSYHRHERSSLSDTSDQRSRQFISSLFSSFLVSASSRRYQIIQPVPPGSVPKNHRRLPPIMRVLSRLPHHARPLG